MEVARIEVLGEDVEGLWILPEEQEIKDGLGPRQVQLGQVGIETRLR